MSDSFWLIVRPLGNATSDDLIRDANTICGTPFAKTGSHSDDESTVYMVPSPSGPIFFDLSFGNDDEGDPNDPIPFGYFPWHFSIDDARDPEWSAIAQRTIRKLYDGLVATGRYECVLQRLSTEEILASNVTQRRPREPEWPTEEPQ